MTGIETRSPSVFESFNARSLNPEQVARSFTPPRQYWQIVKPTHAIVIGPRGSGKTTLLKMLQGPALEAWRHARAPEFRARVEFTGVFIPTDVTWNAQLAAVGGPGMSSVERNVFTLASFTTHVLRQLVSAIQYRVAPFEGSDATAHRRVVLAPDREEILCKEIADQWMLKPALPTLMAIRRALTARLIAIGALAESEALRHPEGRAERLVSVAYLTLPFLESAAFAIEAFEDVAGLRREKWALLFDELELAPDWLRRQLITYLRSVDDRFLFKLSMSPYSQDTVGLDLPTGAMPGSDFEAISLWYAHKEDGFGFCRSLLRSMVTDLGTSEVDPMKLLGRSEFETLSSEWLRSGTAYEPGSRVHRRFASLATKDRTFRRYLREHELDVQRLHEVQAVERAAEVRKVTSIVAVGEAFRAPDRVGEPVGTVKLRSRKNPDLYSGAATLFAMVEGNPRWFIGIVGSLLRGHYLEGGTISPAAQADEVAKAANRFRALLRTIPSSTTTHQGRGVLSMLDPIGRYICRAVVVEEFNPDPPGSFVVDADAGQDLIETLGRALNAGAIVYVPDRDGEVILASLRGKRFRLSYLLAGHYRIPIRLGRAISLSRILAAGAAQQEVLPYESGNE